MFLYLVLVEVRIEHLYVVEISLHRDWYLFLENAFVVEDVV